MHHRSHGLTTLAWNFGHIEGESRYQEARYSIEFKAQNSWPKMAQNPQCSRAVLLQSAPECTMLLCGEVVNGRKQLIWELERPSENHYHRDARASRRWTSGKNKETAKMLRTTFGKNVLMLLMRQQTCSRRPIQAPTGVFPPNKPAGLSSRSCVTSQVHEAFPRAIFAPAGHRLNVFLRRRAPADLSIACPLSC